MKKIFIAGALSMVLCASLSAQDKASANGDVSLKFDASNFQSKSVEIDGKEIKFRAYESIIYVAKPVDKDYQKMNIFIPEEYFKGKKVRGFNAKTAPIFLPNMVGGYMPGKAGEAGLGRDGKPNAISLALSRGYVVAAPAARGRSLKNENGEFTGKAPAAIIDLKAAVRYLKFNDTAMPGDANKIISNGTSAGGALSVLLGASGDEKIYEPYLKALGAANASDKIFAASVYCPITNLEHADMAYEWTFNGVNEYEKMDFSRLNAREFNDRTTKMERKTIKGSLGAEQIEVSNELKARFPTYLNSLNLKEDDIVLSLDKDGNGSFKEYLKWLVARSYKVWSQKNAFKAMPSFIKLDDKSSQISVDWDEYIKYAKRMKTPPAFDGLALENGENDLFGDAKTPAKHFTKFSADRTGGETADGEIVKMMNAMNFIQNENGAKFYRIRHGAIDRDTALAIPAILALSLQNAGKNVDFAVPWEQGHGGDYDLDELFDWTDRISR